MRAVCQALAPGLGAADCNEFVTVKVLSLMELIIWIDGFERSFCCSMNNEL